MLILATVTYFPGMLLSQNSLRKPCPSTCSDLAGFPLDVWVSSGAAGGASPPYQAPTSDPSGLSTVKVGADRGEVSGSNFWFDIWLSGHYSCIGTELKGNG